MNALPSEAQTAILRRLGDSMAPASETMPSYTQVDRSGRFLTRALQALPHLAPRALQAADGLGDADPREYLTRLQQEQPDTFEALHLILVGAYLINRRVWKRIGYPGRKARPVLDDEADFYLEGGLLDPVVARGPIFRPTPS